MNLKILNKNYKMYITVTKQTMDGNYSQSVSDFVAYLEKENEDKSIDEMEHFFNQYGEEISGKEVIQEIDGNTAKLKKTEPKFYSITVNPSAYELKRLQNHSEELKQYTRELMKEYAKSFNREIMLKLNISGLTKGLIGKFRRTNLMQPRYFRLRTTSGK